MERDSFIFYKSFYEAIKDLPNDVQLEVLIAVIEYALFGKYPDNLKPITKGMFTLIKPNIDVNTVRYENGKKGGRKKKKLTEPQKDVYTLSFEEEVEQMKNDEDWRKTICEDFNINANEYEKRLSRFLQRCNEDKKTKGKVHHDSFDDCRSHLRYWMTKAYPSEKTASRTKNVDKAPPSDYTYNGGFGGMDV